MRYPECESCGKSSARWSFVCNGLAAVFKITVGTVTASKGLVADGLHSVADAISSLFIVIALKIAGKPHDEGHPFGHGKVEFLCTLSASIFLFIIASTIVIDALHSFKYGVPAIPKPIAILATAVSLCFSYLMYKSNKCAGMEMGSPALMADAYESKADTISAGAVLIGLIGTQMGFIYADPIAAIVVSLFIFHMAFTMFLQGIHGLVDVSADKEVIDRIVSICLGVKGVEGVREIKTRKIGQKSWVDLIIDISKKRTVIDTHRIAEEVKKTLFSKINMIGGVSVATYPVENWGFREL